MKRTRKFNNLIDLILVLGLMLLLYQAFHYVLQMDNLIPWVAASLLSLLTWVIKRRF